MQEREPNPPPEVEGESGVKYKQTEVPDENLGKTQKVEPILGYNNGLQGE